MFRVSTLLGAVLIAAFAAAPARASLIYDVTVGVSGAGFGSIPRDLTVQGSGNPGYTESGCVSINLNGSIGFTCMTTDAVQAPNGVINTGGDEPMPRVDDQKYGIPTAASLGITSASQIQVISDFTETNGDHAAVTDLTLKFYSTSGGVTSLIGSIDGSQDFPSTIPGNGQAGFAFVISPDEYAYVNSLLGQSNVSFALESTITDASGGPESFFVRNGALTAVPEPASILLFGTGLIGLATKLRSR